MEIEKSDSELIFRTNLLPFELKFNILKYRPLHEVLDLIRYLYFRKLWSEIHQIEIREVSVELFRQLKFLHLDRYNPHLAQLIFGKLRLSDISGENIKYLTQKLNNLREKNTILIYLLIVTLCDNYYKLQESKCLSSGNQKNNVSFFKVNSQLPSELQAFICQLLLKKREYFFPSQLIEKYLKLLF